MSADIGFTFASVFDRPTWRIEVVPPGAFRGTSMQERRRARRRNHRLDLA